MEEELITERVRTVYGKDLYEEYFSMNVRAKADQFEHGDTLRVTVEKLEESPDRDTESSEE